MAEKPGTSKPMKQEMHVVRIVPTHAKEYLQCSASSSRIVASGSSEGQISLYEVDDVDNLSTTQLLSGGLPSSLYNQQVGEVLCRGHMQI